MGAMAPVRFEVRTSFDAPPRRVWDEMVDWQGHERWIPATRMRAPTDDSTAVGAELTAFFLAQGPLGGLLAIGVSTALFSAVAMATFELARLWKAFDYRHFFQRLLGGGWWLFEVCYVGLLLLVLAVVAAASGSIMDDTFGLNYWIGVGVVMVAVGALVFGGNEAIERFFSAWSFVLYAVYIVFFVWCFRELGPEIAANLGAEPAGGGWAWAGLRYAGYNLAVIPPVLALSLIHI